MIFPSFLLTTRKLTTITTRNTGAAAPAPALITTPATALLLQFRPLLLLPLLLLPLLYFKSTSTPTSTYAYTSTCTYVLIPIPKLMLQQTLLLVLFSFFTSVLLLVLLLPLPLLVLCLSCLPLAAMNFPCPFRTLKPKALQPGAPSPKAQPLRSKAQTQSPTIHHHAPSSKPLLLETPNSMRPYNPSYPILRS